MTNGAHNVYGKPIEGEIAKQARVFISHRQQDKAVSSAVGSYFEFIGLHYYLDENDEDLQEALKRGDNEDATTVHAIEKGLEHSTHLLGILSPKTMGSWWVPFEIGSARARGYETAHLIIEMSDFLPKYIRICRNFKDPVELFKWSGQLAHWPDSPIHRYYAEWLSEHNLFKELIEHWCELAEQENRVQLRRLADTLGL